MKWLLVALVLAACSAKNPNRGTTGTSTGATSTGGSTTGGSSTAGTTTGGTATGGTTGATTASSTTGGGLFSHPMPWTKDVSTLAPHPDSATIIGALDTAGGWGSGDFQGDLSIRVLQKTATTPMQTFTPRDAAWALAETGNADNAQFYSPDCVNVPWPVPGGGGIEGEGASTYDCTATGNDGDCHLIVIDATGRKLYEMWRADISGGTFLGGCAVIWDLDKAYDDTLRGLGCTSADAGGFPITAMLATADEVASGEVKHALRFTLPNERIRSFVYAPPGTHSTFATSGGSTLPPYGVRFRLRADYPEAGFGAHAQVVLRALKKYGMFLADGGNIPLIMANDVDTTAKWADLGIDSHTFEPLTVNDFDVVDMGTLRNYQDDDHTDCALNP